MTEALLWALAGLVIWLGVAFVVGVLIGKTARNRDRQVPGGDR